MRDERGAVSLETVLIVPVLLALLGLSIAGGRLWLARAEVATTAGVAARAATLARSPGEARSMAHTAAAANLAGGPCRHPQVAVDTSAFGVAVGRPAVVSTRITCAVSFGDVLLPGMPGSMTVSAHGASTLDTYRER